MKASAIIQARLGSTRLPGKVLLTLADKTVLEHVIQRALKARSIQEVVVATTQQKENSQVADVAQRCQVKVYRGSENDVLDRYYQAAKLFSLHHIVRITSDCPVIDPQVIDGVINKYFETEADYCSNTITKTLPDGEDVEVFSFQALERAWREADIPSEREHVTPYLKKHKDLFKIVSCDHDVDLGEKRWSLDREEDYRFLKILFEHLYTQNHYFGMAEILKFLKEHPETEKINSHVVRDEGYLKSLEEDKKLKGKKKVAKA
jgi:spore coat polysaccharide biosynthesis protein SpsF (cytidylyltransferase family)